MTLVRRVMSHYQSSPEGPVPKRRLSNATSTAGTSLLEQPPVKNYRGSLHKRRRIPSGSPSTSHFDSDNPSAPTVPRSSPSQPIDETHQDTDYQLPVFPYLYHLAVSAHHASAGHLQQIFIPPEVSINNTNHPVLWYGGPNPVSYRPDPGAIGKATALLLLSLDLLQVGLKSRELSDKERVAFGLEFAVVAIKLIKAQDTAGEQQVKEIDITRIGLDAREAVGIALHISRKSAYLLAFAQQLVLIEARLLFMKGNRKAAIRVIRQELSMTPRTMHAHRYALFLLHLELEDASTSNCFNILHELMSDAADSGHSALIELSMLIQLRLLFQHRRWADIPAALDELGHQLPPAEPTPQGGNGVQNPMGAWITYMQLHHNMYKALWEGRNGSNEEAKRTLKTLYVIMDNATDQHIFQEIANTGGHSLVELPSLNDDVPQVLVVQLTPPNITHIMTYLVTVTVRRDYNGSSTACKNLIMPKMLRDNENVRRGGEMWDLNFINSHGIADALTLRKEVVKIRVEVKLEEATALMFRGETMEADKVLQEILKLVITYDLFTPYAPQLCLVHAQLAHLLGRSNIAVQLYDASLVLLKPGSELSLLVEMNSLAAKGELLHVASNAAVADRVRTLVSRCITSTNSTLSAAGNFVGSLLEAHRTASKKKLTTAYDISRKANYNILRCLIFAYTTSVHVYGVMDQSYQQLETGRELARLMGGSQRADGVGQTALGAWFAVKLEEHYRREGQAEAYAKAKDSQEKHLRRVEEQKRGVKRLTRDFV